MVIAILLLAVLFIAGLINIFFYFPSYQKFSAWLQSFFPNKSQPTISTISSQSSFKEISVYRKAELRKVFATFDKNGDGFIAKQELKESLRNLRLFMTDKEVEEMVMKVDANGDGLIDFEEFCLLCESLVGERVRKGDGKEIAGRGDVDDHDQEGNNDDDDGEEDLKEAFDVFDKDKDGLISVEELGLVLSSLGLKEGKKIEDCKAMIKKVDMDGDGMVNFHEFKRMMRSGGLLVSTF